MKPIHYNVHLEPDLTNFTFKGVVDVDINTETPVDNVILNANALVVQSCQLIQGDHVQACKFAFDEKRQELSMSLPVKVEGHFSLKLAYTGEINDMMMGLYRSRYEYEGETRYVAVTQFEEREARRAFPCFDQPSKKATFDITFLIDATLTGIANTAIAEEVPADNGKKLVRFERTPKMSTYLLFFGIGEFEFIEDASERPLVRVATTPGKTQYGAFGLDMGRKSLSFGEEYTGIDFPISKCDHIAVADFAFGAMENYGAITYRENLLLVYPGVTSKQDLARVATVIAHETAHMWFGDLVSPASWGDIWLNESFATYFTYAITNKYYPEWRLWDIFLSDSVLRAMMRDSLQGTVPIELPGDNEEINIDASSAPIIYSKGAAIIRMLTAYLGEEKLKLGINRFLNLYAFDCANSKQYWDAFEAATGEPVSEFAASWIYQPGYPLVDVRREGDVLHLSQRRFGFVDVAEDEREQLWFIPIDILAYDESGEPQVLRTVLREKFGTVVLPTGTVAYKLNANQAGYYRVKYEASALDALGRLIRDQKLSAADSLGVENDLFALVSRGDYPVAGYLTFVETYFADETRPLPLGDVVENLMLLYRLLDKRRDAVAQVGRGMFERALERIGYTPRPDDGLLISMLRNGLLWSAFSFGSEAVWDFGEAQFQRLLNGDSVHEDILSSVLKMGAATSDKALEYLIARGMDAATPETEKILILRALGCFKDEEKLRAVLELNLESVPKKNRAYMMHTIAQNPIAVPFLWQWFLDHFEALRLLHPSHLERIVVSLVPITGYGREAEVTQFLRDLAKQRPEAGGTVDMTLEIMEVYGQIRRAA